MKTVVYRSEKSTAKILFHIICSESFFLNPEQEQILLEDSGTRQRLPGLI